MKLISYLLSSVFAFVFFLILLIFHPLQWLGLKLFGQQKGHQRVVDVMNWFIVKSLLILGVRVSVKNAYQLPENKSLIFVANHQSMFDIPPIIWHFRRYYPKFVSKKELGKGIPSISFNLRHGGAALINRKDAKQALSELENYAKRINSNKWSAVIFPEGTRSRNGNPKNFSVNGLKMIIKHNPEAVIVPLSINNSWKIFKYGKFPLGVFSPLTIEVSQPIQLSKDVDTDIVLAEIEKQIKEKIKV